MIASNGGRNLEGKAKAKYLYERFLEGFICVGDSAADLAVWRKSKGSVLAGGSGLLLKRIRRLNEPVAVFSERRSLFSVRRRSLRLHQWAKNALLFVPFVLGGKVSDITAWTMALLEFAAHMPCNLICKHCRDGRQQQSSDAVF